MSSTILNFGKHNGECLYEVPLGYLAWMRDNKPGYWGPLSGQILDERIEGMNDHDIEDVVLTFGQHKGLKIGDLEMSYISWMADEMGSPWGEIAEREKISRQSV